jgi:hypothetical protein
VLNQGGGFGNCSDLELRWTANETVDMTFDVVFDFTFGTPIGIVIETRVGTSLAYLANGSGTGSSWTAS